MNLMEIGWMHESPVPNFVWQHYQYKLLPSYLIALQEIDEDSIDTVLMADDVTLKTLSPSQETKVIKMVLDGYRKCNQVHIAD
jgi:hypothetical protein